MGIQGTKPGDRVFETTTGTGTGNLVLDGAQQNAQTFLGHYGGGSTSVPVVIVNRDVDDEWEIGLHGVNDDGSGNSEITRSAGNVLTGSSGAGSLVSFSAGTKEVYSDFVAAQIGDLFDNAAFINEDIVPDADSSRDLGSDPGSSGKAWAQIWGDEVYQGGNRLAMEKITSGSISSNTSSVDLTDLSTDYRAYLLVFSNLVPQTDDNVFIVRFSSDNGANFDSGASDYARSRIENVEGTGADTGGGSLSEIAIINEVGANAGEEVSGFMWIIDPANTNTKPQIQGQATGQDKDDEYRHTIFAGERRSAAAFDAVRLKFNTDNIAEMDYTLYGVRA